MPQHEEHCVHSEKRYGVRGDEIHAWMDEPSRISGGSHRNFRHDLNSLPTAIQIFGKLYGAEVVENIFLDHLKADSEENRKHERESNEDFNPKLWSNSEDDFLIENFFNLSDDELEAQLQTKSKAEIRKRREYFGLIRPRMIKGHTNYEVRKERVVFKLQKGQQIFISVKVTGGNNDVNFGTFRHQGGSVLRFVPTKTEMIIGNKSFAYNATVTGNYCFFFDNSFSVFTSKIVEFSYHLENGKEIRTSFSV